MSSVTVPKTRMINASGDSLTLARIAAILLLWRTSLHHEKIFSIIKKTCRVSHLTANIPPVRRMGVFGLVGFVACGMSASAGAQAFAPAKLHLAQSRAEKQASPP